MSSRVQSNPMNVLSLIAGESFVAKQYRAVCLAVAAAARTVTTIAAAAEGAHIIGVVQNKAPSGDSASVATGGSSILEMAANCDSGEKIMSDSDGKGTPVGTDKYGVIGIALTSNAEGDGGLIEVLLTPGGVGQADESN
ncbi:MAG: DUF2190 family protein [Candidatus Peribacteraceae bacterium]|nr:DUF2190 family protein [Candidatus Peribacteraceae bacterium]